MESTPLSEDDQHELQSDEVDEEPSLEVDKKPPLEEHPDWTTGDFTLISSDNVLFKVDSHVFLGSSLAFRNMLGLVKGLKEITFVDAELERSRIICKFLRIISTGMLHVEPKLPHILDLLKFCEKYECDVPFQAIINILRNSISMDDNPSLVEAFVIGATVDDLELCTAVLKRACSTLEIETAKNPHAYYNRPKDGDGKWRVATKRTGAATSIVSVHDLPDSAWMTCQLEYLWALHQSTENYPEPDMWQTFRLDVLYARSVLAPGAHSAINYGGGYDRIGSAAWTEGDLVLYSSNNAKFLIASYYIWAASPALRKKMVKEGDVPTIRFDDKTFETASTLRMFLELITSGQLVLPDAQERPTLIPPHLLLATFLSRYECTAALQTLCMHCQLDDGDKPSVRTLFVAILCDNDKLVSQITRRLKDKNFSAAGGRSGSSAVNRCPKSSDPISFHSISFDPISWPLALWMIFPRRWLLSYCYAHDHADKWEVTTTLMEDKLGRLRQDERND